MRKPPTGEPSAGEPHARFGGRGGRKPFPTPISLPRRRYSGTHVSCPLPRLRCAATRESRASKSLVGLGDNAPAVDHLLSCIWLGLLRRRGPSGHETSTLADDLPSGLWAWLGNRFKYCLTALVRLRPEEILGTNPIYRVSILPAQSRRSRLKTSPSDHHS